ncbi:MAG TPA: LacI family DNA-binding transcriptional regulator [Solirubrobacteraceae bacterium]|nr:LacI family DNA-binding transcriptional regulator [Solirubrobacteraceae bacterium]
MTGRPRKPGVVAVARAAGVSASTVSNAFNRPERLSPELRERVLRAAAELGYGGADPVARSLRSGRAGAIGIVFRKPLAKAFDDPATARLLRGVSDVTDPQQLAIVLVPGLPDEEPSVAPAVGNAAVDGLIVYSLPGDDPLVAATRRRRVPIVIVDSPALDELPAPAGLDFVGIDDVGAAETAVRHLLDLGHRSLAILSLGLSAYAHPGPAGIDLQAQATASVPKARLEGCARAVAAAGLDWSGIPVEQRPANDIASGCAGTHALLDRAPSVTALFAFSDPLALGAMLAARERGLSVPEDLSIVGFDDTAPAGEELTSVHQPLRDKGRIAAERLLRAQAPEPPAAPSELLPTSLVVRASTGPPRPA